MTTTTRSKKFPIYAGIGLIAAIWIGVFSALAIMQPPLKTKMLILAGGAGATELVLYAGAAWFGINLFQKLRSIVRSRRS